MILEKRNLGDLLRSLTFGFAISAFIVGNCAVGADEDLKDFQEILKKYDDMPYSEKAADPKFLPEKALGFPFCLAVVLRQGEERKEMVRSFLKGNPTLQGYFDDFEISTRLQYERAIPSGKKDEKTGEFQRPLFFGPDTKVRSIKVGKDGSLSEGDGPIQGVAAEDYVLSTTAHLLEDSRYHEVCWARVHNTLSKEIAQGGKLGSIHYVGKQDNGVKVVSTLDPLLTLYVHLPDRQGIERLPCDKLKLNMELVSPVVGDDKVSGACRFAIVDSTTVAASATSVYNLDVELTGTYFIGDSQILVHH